MSDFDQCADGNTYDHDRDHERIAAQRQRVWNVMVGGHKRTLGEISTMTGDPEASVSARLRDLRKPRFGGHTVEKRYLHDGLWIYWVIPAEPAGETNGEPPEWDWELPEEDQ